MYEFISKYGKAKVLVKTDDGTRHPCLFLNGVFTTENKEIADKLMAHPFFDHDFFLNKSAKKVIDDVGEQYTGLANELEEIRLFDLRKIVREVYKRTPILARELQKMKKVEVIKLLLAKPEITESIIHAT